MDIKKIQGFFNEHYGDGKADDETIEEFFEGEIAFRPQGDWYEDEEGDDKNSGLDTAQAFQDSGTLDLVIDALTVLDTDPKWVILTDYGTDSFKVIMKVPKVPDYYLIIKDLKKVMEASVEGVSGIPHIHNDITWIPNSDDDEDDDEDEIGFADIKDWENNGVPGCWFDGDGHKKGAGWGYTEASKFLDSQTGFKDKSYLSYLIYLEDEIMITILNWTQVFYKNLFKVIGVKV